MRHFFKIFPVICLLLVSVQQASASECFGARIPTQYFATMGAGQSNDGIPPDPYETFSYDAALDKAGIEDFNIVFYTSVIPPEAKQISFQKAKKYFHHGAVLESIMARVGGHKGETAVAGVATIDAKNSKGKHIGGYAAEYEYLYHHKISRKDAIASARKQLTKSLQHILEIRHFKQNGPIKFHITSLYITKKYGMALSDLGFVGFKYPNCHNG